jgi:hypothetical protein
VAQMCRAPQPTSHRRIGKRTSSTVTRERRRRSQSMEPGKTATAMRT